jgi:hypothetical protein
MIAEMLDSARIVYIAENVFALAEIGLVKHCGMSMYEETTTFIAYV